MSEQETIVAVAVRYEGLTVSLPAPARHHNVLHPLFDLTGKVLGGQDQGFLTSKGRFVNRFEAARIAVRAKQIVEPRWPPDLYSEDVW
ncbi:p063 [Mesorhizobium plurifarium]|uniref:p063 n=1 Tax=Mesorhizobium plurifarium TaxID=69974 RepID=A0A0K2VVM1_MESPL|nr:p063 [Mesorhizobium plurifarium]